MFTERTSVGLDVHARSITAAAIDTDTDEITRRKMMTADHFLEVLAFLASLAGPVAVVYEAGPTGYGLARTLREHGYRCEVAAPSRLPRKPGDRRKTDPRDALKLANALRADQVTSVVVPSIEREDARDLTRTFEDSRVELMAARHRLSKMLLRRGLVYYDGKTWTGAHDRWLRAQRGLLSGYGTLASFDDYYETVVVQTARRKRLEKMIIEYAADSEFTVMTRRLACLKGISTVSAFALTVEIGDWDRFTGASIGAYLGLAAGERSSGASIVRGPITKDGNTHARRLLTEAAWHHTPNYRAGTVLRRRWEDVDDPAVAVRAHAGNRRLSARRSRLLDRGLDARKVNTAIARELAGWCWSLAVLGHAVDDQEAAQVTC